MDKLLYTDDIELALRRVGELLEADGERFSVVVIGGAALQLLGIISRATRDVDIVAFAASPAELRDLRRPPEPLPRALASAIAQVARDFGLPENWMNRGPAAQWDIGLPPGFSERVHWRRYGGLDIGLADRLDLICLKLEAAADQPTDDSRHFRDLIALACTDDELTKAAAWARTKNVGAEYHAILDRVLEHVANSR